jgi:hypothetical protein
VLDWAINGGNDSNWEGLDTVISVAQQDGEPHGPDFLRALADDAIQDPLTRGIVVVGNEVLDPAKTPRKVAMTIGNKQLPHLVAFPRLYSPDFNRLMGRARRWD